MCQRGRGGVTEDCGGGEAGLAEDGGVGRLVRIGAQGVLKGGAGGGEDGIEQVDRRETGGREAISKGVSGERVGGQLNPLRDGGLAVDEGDGSV